jgi:hypothetical protein
MTDGTSIADCTGTSSPSGHSDPSCSCSVTIKPKRTKVAKFGAGFLALCAICCAVPPALIALGFVGAIAGAYLSAGLTMALIVLTLLGLTYLSISYVKKKR